MKIYLSPLEEHFQQIAWERGAFSVPKSSALNKLKIFRIFPIALLYMPLRSPLYQKDDLTLH